MTSSSGSRKRKHRGHRTFPQSPPSTRFNLPNYYGSSTHYPRTPHDHDHNAIDNTSNKDTSATTKPDPLHALYIQAYEADIVRGSHAQTAAQSLEVVEYSTSVPHTAIIPKIGSALIRWGGDASSVGPQRYGRGDDDDMLPLAVQDMESAIWVDRYDARLLLDTLSNPNPMVPTPGPVSKEPDSPTGWSDLPSDTEDTFFFTPDETEDFRREKRRRLLERTREERLKARMEEDHVEDEENQEEEDVWGGSDEEPDDPQQQLMRRTATHLLSSPNAAQLEMRILANYGSDKRFAFLRGRWSRKWSLIKAQARLETEKNKETEEMEKNQAGSGMGLVTGYGSDDEDSEGDDDVAGEPGMTAKGKDAVHSPPAEPSDSTTVVEEAAKEARRKRAKEWAEKRREMKFKGDT